MYDGHPPSVDNPVSGVTGFATEHATGALVMAALAMLILIRRGFRGVSAGGVGVSIR